jgi:hypothetical protein
MQTGWANIVREQAIIERVGKMEDCGHIDGRWALGERWLEYRVRWST